MKFYRFLAICLTLCVLSSFSTFCITKSIISGRQTPANKKEKAVDQYSATLILSDLFKGCNHTTAELYGTISYSSKDELEKRFPGYKITSGEGENIVLTKETDGFCPNHYKAVLLNDKIKITRISDRTDITAFKIIPSSLSKQEKSLLEQGVTLNSKETLSSFIEDFTS